MENHYMKRIADHLLQERLETSGAVLMMAVGPLLK